MKKYLPISLLTIVYLFLCPAFSFAQNQDSTAIEDSTYVEEEYDDSTDDFSNYQSDTVLEKFETGFAFDSTNTYKSGKDFAYIKYLDSLLKHTKGLTVDTFSIGENKNVKNKRRLNRLQPPASGSTMMDSSFIKFILWILALGFIVFVLYRLFLTESIFKRAPRKHSLTQTPQQEENISDPSAYEKLINEAITKNDFRLAIRYLYLQTLQKLSVAGLILFSPDKTNYEYLKELSGKAHQSEFASLTRNYEYAWYGKFDIQTEVFNKLQNNFKEYHKKI